MNYGQSMRDLRCGHQSDPNPKAVGTGNCICRKNCRKKGFKVYDYVHSNLPGVKAHLAQVERGTKLWDHYFVPRMKTKDKSKKLKRFGTYLYVAEDIGLMAYVQNDYKFMMFGKTTPGLRVPHCRPAQL